MLKIAIPSKKLPIFERQVIPPLWPVEIEYDQARAIDSLPDRIINELSKSKKIIALNPGASLAIAVGSRGIASLKEVVAAVVKWLKDRGLKPFIVPAMGSHGGATANGQKEILSELGVDEKSVGAEIRSAMETVNFGKTKYGVDCHFDKAAATADGIIIINRVKPHTSFDRPIESGLIKMIAVGLGKAEGARNVHRLGVKGLAEVLPELAQTALHHAPILYGLALVENQTKQLTDIAGIEPECFFETEKALLKKSKAILPRLPFDRIDVLISVWMGKNISGAGLDYAITGRTDIRGLKNPKKPFVSKLAVLRMTPESHGNAMGIGVADFTTTSLVGAIDFNALYMNALTATFVEKAKIPVVLTTEESAIQAALATCWEIKTEAVKMVIIRSTLDVKKIWVSDALVQEIASRGIKAKIGEKKKIAFNSKGEIEDLFGRFPV